MARSVCASRLSVCRPATTSRSSARRTARAAQPSAIMFLMFVHSPWYACSSSATRATRALRCRGWREVCVDARTVR
eukprot:3669207-Prymnesium_polylepis.1